MNNLNNPTLGLLSILVSNDLFKDMNCNKPKPMSFEEAKRIIEEQIKDIESAMNVPKSPIITRHTDEITLSNLKAYLDTKPEVVLYSKNFNNKIGTVVGIDTNNQLMIEINSTSARWKANECILINPFNTAQNIKIIDDVSDTTVTFNKLTIEALNNAAPIRCEVFNNICQQNGNTSVRTIVQYDTEIKRFIDIDGNTWKYAIAL